MEQPKQKSPQEELDELLRQAGVSRPTRTGGLKLKIPTLNPVKMRIKKEHAIMGGLGLILLITTLVFLIQVARPGGSTLTIESNQADYTLQIDKRKYSNVDEVFSVKVRPGEHKLVASKEGFLDHAEEFKIEGDKPATLAITLLPIPEAKVLLTKKIGPMRFNRDGKEVSYFNPETGTFDTTVTATGETTELFRGSFSNVKSVAWSMVGPAAIVQFEGMPQFENSLDHRSVKGRYVVLGERPEQAPTLSNGTSTWLFDDAFKTSAGWQPVLLSQNIRQFAFASDGSQVVYIYEGADGEYSLVQALPDGLEWERVIRNMPRLSNPVMTWSSDPRYLMIRDDDKVYVVDMNSKSIEEILQDREKSLDFAVSTTGDKIAYVTGGDSKKLKTYDLLERTTVDVEGFNPDGAKAMAWLDLNSVLIAMQDGTFRKVEIVGGKQSFIPFVGASVGNIQSIRYSPDGRLLLIVSDGGLYTMAI